MDKNDNADPLQSLGPQSERKRFLMSTCIINKVNTLSQAVLKPLLWFMGSERDALIMLPCIIVPGKDVAFSKYRKGNIQRWTVHKGSSFLPDLQF